IPISGRRAYHSTAQVSRRFRPYTNIGSSAMKLRVLILLGLATVSIVAARKTEVSAESLGEEEPDEYEYEEPETVLHRKKTKINEHISKKTQEFLERRKDDKDSNELEPKGKKEKKEEADESDKPLLICDGTKLEACTCEINEVNCVNIIFEDDSGMSSADVALSKENKNLEGFKPLVAHFEDNVITRLQRNRMPEGMEESLAAIYLQRNKISRIDARAFDGFLNISKIVLSKNWLKTIRSDMFAGDLEKTLHTLDLSYNRIKVTEKSPFRKLKNLKKLVLDGNELVLDEDFFEGLDKLETLSMDECDFDDKNMPKGLFEPFKNLKKLSLRGNKFTEVPEILEEIKHLQILDLSETSIAELHRQSFVGEPELTTLYFEYMPFLASIQDSAFCGLTHLKTLSFHNSSKLTIIDENAFGFMEFVDDRAKSLIDLKLSKSNISTLSTFMLEYDTLERLDLDRSPLNCTCDMIFLRNVKFPSGFATNARCAYPKEMNGKYLDQALTKELCGSRYARGYRFFFALFGVISAAIFVTAGYIMFNKGYRFTNIRNIPMPSLPGANSAYTNLSRQEENELSGEKIPESPRTLVDNTPDFQPRAQMV
ncbi:hypothetical protein PENTCL1PPCAC_29641, partial [Pristionchus entomophagus]